MKFRKCQVKNKVTIVGDINKLNPFKFQLVNPR